MSRFTFTRKRKDRFAYLVRTYFDANVYFGGSRYHDCPSILFKNGPYFSRDFVRYELDTNKKFPELTQDLKQKLILFVQEITKFLPLNIIKFRLYRKYSMEIQIVGTETERFPPIRNKVNFFTIERDGYTDVVFVVSELFPYTAFAVAKRISKFLQSLNFEVKNSEKLKDILQLDYPSDALHIAFPLENPKKAIKEFEEKLIEHEFHPTDIRVEIFYRNNVIQFDEVNPVVIKYVITPFPTDSKRALLSDDESVMSKILDLLSFISRIDHNLLRFVNSVIEKDAIYQKYAPLEEFFPQDFKAYYLKTVFEVIRLTGGINLDFCLPEITEILKKIYLQKTVKI